jgi:hypothetical protein
MTADQLIADVLETLRAKRDAYNARGEAKSAEVVACCMASIARRHRRRSDAGRRDDAPDVAGDTLPGELAP